MKFEFDLSDTPRSAWDSEIMMYESLEICQTSIFGEFIEKSGKKPAFVSIYQNGDLIGHCLAEISRQKISSWLYGPLLKSEVMNLQEEIIFEMCSFLQMRGIIAVENTKTQKCFNPRVKFDERSSLYNRIGESPFIDIHPDMKTIMDSFDRSVRKNVNKCERNGVEIMISEKDDLLEPYLNMLTSFRAERHFGMPTFFPNHETMKSFNSHFTSMGIALVKHEGNLLAGMGFVTIGHVMTELAMASSEKYEIAKLPINDFIKVKAIDFYKRRGITIYDLAGGERNPTDLKKKNILVFKNKFATGAAPFGMIDRKVLSSAWYPNAVLRKLKFLLGK